MHENSHRLSLDQQMRQTAVSALIAAALMLLFGFNAWSGGLHGASASQIYNLSVAAFVWTLLIGGFSMVASAVLCLARWRHALAVDALFAGCIGVLLMAIGGVQIAHDGIRNLTAGLMLIFGFLFLRSAHMSWGTYVEFMRAAGAEEAIHQEATGLKHGREEDSKQQALERLLAGKRREPERETTADHPSFTTSSDERVQRTITPDEDVEGFLAELGRNDDDTERK